VIGRLRPVVSRKMIDVNNHRSRFTGR